MVLAQEEQSHQLTHHQHSTTSLKTMKVSKRLVSRNAGVEGGHRGGGLGSSWECDAEEHVPRAGHQANREVQEWKRIQRTRRREHQEQVMSVRSPEQFVRKSTWQVADVRRPLVSASHIIQAGNDLFIGKDEAYIVNRM